MEEEKGGKVRSEDRERKDPAKDEDQAGSFLSLSLSLVRFVDDDASK